jgi:hypothetical protein
MLAFKTRMYYVSCILYIEYLYALQAVVADLHGLLLGELGVAAKLGQEGGEEVQLQVHLTLLPLPLRLLLGFASCLGNNSSLEYNMARKIELQVHFTLVPLPLRLLLGLSSCLIYNSPLEFNMARKSNSRSTLLFSCSLFAFS